jgi:uncharacterized membrane protein
LAKPPERVPDKDSGLPPEAEDALAREIERQIGPLVNKGQKDQIVERLTRITSERFQGPIAHPRHLREYEEILPGAAERILAMAESELRHSQEMQVRVVDAEVNNVKSGRAYGFSALVLIISAAGGAAYLDQIAIALAFLGTGVLGIITTLVTGRRNQREPDE